MSRAREFKLVDVAARRACWESIRTLPADWTVTVYPPNRTKKQNRRLHWLLGKIVKAKIELDGRLWDTEDWRAFMISAHAKATRGERDDQQESIVVGIEGEPVQVRESSATMSKERISSLIEYIQSWMAGRPEFDSDALYPPEWEGR